MRSAIEEGIFAGGLPYLRLGTGRPLLYLCGSTPNHRAPRPGFERNYTVRSIRPLVERGFAVYFTNRWPQMSPHTTIADIAQRHATAILEHFGGPVDVLGHSTGGSIVLELIADRPDTVRRAVVASAAYTLGPVARRGQLRLLQALEDTGRYTTDSLVEMSSGVIPLPAVRFLVRPLAALAARRVDIDRPEDTIAMLRAEEAFDVRDRLPRITTETLVIYGAKDHYWTPEMFAETAYRMPNAHLVMLPDHGHNLVTARPFFDHVVNFLTRS